MHKKIALMVLFACSVVAFGDSFEFSAQTDARILSVFPTSNFGSDILSTYNFPGNVQRTVMQFDVSTISSSSSVTSAKLRLNGQTFNGGNESQLIEIYRVVRNWTENEVTWLTASTGNGWTNAGGDFVGTTGVQGANPYSATTINGGATNQWFEFDVTSLVQDWVSGTHANQGLLLSGSQQSSFVFVQSEATGNLLQPQLIVSTDPIPEPATFALLAGIPFLINRRNRTKA